MSDTKPDAKTTKDKSIAKVASGTNKLFSRRAVLFFGAMSAIGTGGIIGLISRRILSYITGPKLTANEQAAQLSESLAAINSEGDLYKLKLERINSPRLAVAKLSDLHHSEGKIVTDYCLQPVLLLKTPDDKCIARSAVCTHLGCTVQPNLIDGKIFCPCHASYFDVATGNPLSGPATLPLSEEPIVIEGKTIYLLRPSGPIKIGPMHTEMEPV
jgi:Rieske Fe-S protein